MPLRAVVILLEFSYGSLPSLHIDSMLSAKKSSSASLTCGKETFHLKEQFSNIQIFDRLAYLLKIFIEQVFMITLKY
jgi:hypothetical protein